MKSFTIHRILPDEWQQFKDIRLRALSDSPDSFGTTLAETQAQTDAYWQQRAISSASSDTRFLAIATAGDEWVGVAGGMFEDDESEIAEVVSVWIDPEYRRAGLASSLVETVADWAYGRGAIRLELWVTTTNEPAVRLYRQLGFLETGEIAPARPGSVLLEAKMRRAL